MKKQLLLAGLLLSLFLTALGSQAAAQSVAIKAGESLWLTHLKQQLSARFTKQPAPFVQAGISESAALQLSRRLTAQVKVKKPFRQPLALMPFEKYANHFIFTISSPTAKKGFQASGFVFAEEYNGQTVLWGLTAAHVVQNMDPQVNVTFYADGQTYTYPAQIVLSGRKYGLNAALIQLPPQAAEVARPILPADTETKTGTTVFAYGFNNGSYTKTLRKVLAVNGERLVTDWEPASQTQPGFAGSLVLNNHGQAIGIETGGYSPRDKQLQWYLAKEQFPTLPQADLSHISEVVPFSRAYDLLRQYRRPGSARRVMLFDGVRIGYLSPHEFVAGITVYYQDGSSKQLARNPFFDLLFLDSLFDLTDATQAEIIIRNNHTQTYSYLVDLKQHKVAQKGV